MGPLPFAVLVALLGVVTVVHCQVPAALQQLITEKEMLVRNLRDDVERLWDGRCNVNCDCLAYDSCMGGLPLECTQNFGQPSQCDADGRRVMMEQSSVYFAVGTDPTSEPFRQSVCFSKSLDDDFKANLQQYPTTKWTYFGSASGTYRNYPGVIWDKDEFGNCINTFDPRIRPWYVAASSGPKDVVLILDTSGSMGLGRPTRMETAKNAAISVIGTLGYADFATVISFDSVTASSAPTLLQATAANKQTMIQFIQDMSPSGATNYELAFQKLFDVIQASDQQELTGNCETAVLFLSDGDISEGLANQTLLDWIKSTNTATRQASIFTYGLGNSISEEKIKAIACDNKGVYVALPDNADFRSQMNSYYEYFAAGIRSDDVVWSEVYIDALGLGQMTSAAIACYDRTTTPSRLIGVMSTDVTMEELLPLASRTVIENFLLSKSKACPNFSLDTCQLEDFRASSVGNQALCGLGCPPYVPPESSCVGGNSGIISPEMCNTQVQMDDECCSGATQQLAGLLALYAAYLLL